MITPLTSDLPVSLTTDNIAAVPNSDAISNFLEEQKDEVFNFSKARIFLKKLIDDWTDEVKLTDERRKTRDVDINVQALRDSGKLDEDETIIPDRVIDNNITREQPPYINYLKNSRRLSIFTCISNPDINSQRLELEFTQGMSYIGWELPHYKCLDGAQTHGWDSIEVVYDEDKPLHVGLEQVGHDQLFFPRSSLNLQNAPYVLRAYDVTLLQLKKFTDSYGFDKAQVGIIIDSIKNTQRKVETVQIFKRLCKYDGQVYVDWFSIEKGCSDWLKSPAPLFLGISTQVQTLDMATGQPKMVPQDTPIRQYPIYLLPYRETEKPKLIDHKGRVFYDENKQEAQTAVLSAFVNGLTRASNVYASYDTDDGSGGSLQEIENINLTGGRILNKPIRFFHPDYPDPMVLKALQYFDVANDVEMNKPNFAAMNREDSRKTAKEITAAQQEQQLLSSTQLTLFSTHIRAIYNLVWLIVQSQAMQSKIKFLLIKKQKPQINPVLSTPMSGPDGQPMMEDYFENDFETIKQMYDIRAAGDVDVIQKQEKVAQMKQDFPVIANTVLKDDFLAELIRLEYPDTGEKWALKLEQQGGAFEQMKSLVAQLSTYLTGAIQDAPDVLKHLQPNEQAMLTQALQQAQSITQTIAQPTK